MSEDWSSLDLIGPPPGGARPLRRLFPPYRERQWLPWQESGGKGVDGTVALLPIYDESALAGGELAEWVRGFRRAHPSVPMSLLLEESARGEIADHFMRSRVGRNGRVVRAVLTSPYSSDELREALTLLQPWGAREWLMLQRQPATAADIGTLTLLSQVVAGIHPASDIGVDLTAHLRRLGLPPVSRWRMLAKALKAALTLQRMGSGVAEAARTAGYTEPSSFRRHCRDLFAVAPSSIAVYWGWEPLLNRFLASG